MKISTKHIAVTPSENFLLCGYVPAKKATGKLDDIIMSSIIFDDGSKRLLLVNIDLCFITPLIKEALNNGIKTEYHIDEVVFSATHNHSGPSVHGLDRFGILDSNLENEYLGGLSRELSLMVKWLIANLQETTCKIGEVGIEGIYSSRLNPEKPINKKVKSLKFYDNENSLIAEYLNIAVHSTVLGVENTLYSGDLVGNLAKEIYSEIGVYPLVHVGSAGDSSTRFLRQGSDSKELKRVVGLLKDQIMRVENNEDVVLDSISKDIISYRVKRSIDINDASIKANLLRKRLRIEMDQVSRKLIQSKLFALNVQVERGNIDITLNSNVFSIGKIKIITFPLEVDASLVREMYTSKYNLLCNYANDYYGYIINQNEYDNTYEGMSSIFEKGEAEMYIKEIVEKLKTT